MFKGSENKGACCDQNKCPVYQFKTIKRFFIKMEPEKKPHKPVNMLNQKFQQGKIL
jgi:hypothetical protein